MKVSKVGDLVRHDQGFIGVVLYIREHNDDDEVKVAWNDGDVSSMSVYDLEVISESR